MRQFLRYAFPIAIAFYICFITFSVVRNYRKTLKPAQGIQWVNGEPKCPDGTTAGADENAAAAGMKDVAVCADPVAIHLAYGHAVVSGGIWTVGELFQAYPSMGANAHLIYLDIPRSLFVSYKRDGKIYWTKQPHNYPAGTAMWTDGVTFVLQRCGNEVRFDLPDDAVTEPNEPTDLDTPVVQPTPLIDTTGPVIPGDPTPIYACGLECLGVSTPPAPPLTPSPSCYECGFIPFVPPPPPVATPEPSAALMILISICGVVLMRLARDIYKRRKP